MRLEIVIDIEFLSKLTRDSDEITRPDVRLSRLPRELSQSDK